MGLVQKDALRTTLISSFGLVLGYLNKGLLFLLIFSTEQIGVVNLIFSLGVLFAQFSNLGSLYSIWKFFPFFKNRDKAHHGFLAFMLILVGIGATCVTAFFLMFSSRIQAAYLEKSPLFLEYYYWVIPLGLGYLLYLVFEVYLRALFKNIISVFALDIVLRLAVTLLLLLFWNGSLSFDQFVAGHSLLFFLPPLILIGYLIRIKEFYIHPKHIQISKRFKKILLNYSGFNYINSLGGVLVNSLDVIMIAQYIGLKATGVYTTIIFLTSALQVPYKSLIRVSAPLVAEYWKTRDLIKMRQLYAQVSSVSLVLGLGLFLVVWVNIDFLFSFLKPEFSTGIGVFFFLMIGRLFDMYFGLNGAIFNTSKKYRYDLIFTLSLIIIVYVLNLYLIPIYGIEGAAISTAIALVIYNMGRLLFVYFTYKIHPFNGRQLIVIVIGLLCFYTRSITPDLSAEPLLNALVVTSLTVLCYFGSILVLNLEPELKNYLRNGIRHISKNFKS